jgi:hypothetical protein
MRRPKAQTKFKGGVLDDEVFESPVDTVQLKRQRQVSFVAALGAVAILFQSFASGLTDRFVRSNQRLVRSDQGGCRRMARRVIAGST